MKVKEVMTKNIITAKPETSVKDIADILLKHNIGGVPVVNENDELVGIVTEGDLIVKDIRIHFPTYIQLLDAIIYLGGVKRFEEEFRKAIGATAEQVMTKNVYTVKPEDDVEEAATLMFEKHVSRIPVVEGKKIVGIISKRDIIKSIAAESESNRE